MHTIGVNAPKIARKYLRKYLLVLILVSGFSIASGADSSSMFEDYRMTTSSRSSRIFSPVSFSNTLRNISRNLPAKTRNFRAIGYPVVSSIPVSLASGVTYLDTLPELDTTFPTTLTLMDFVSELPNRAYCGVISKVSKMTATDCGVAPSTTFAVSSPKGKEITVLTARQREIQVAGIGISLIGNFDPKKYIPEIITPRTFSALTLPNLKSTEIIQMPRLVEISLLPFKLGKEYVTFALGGSRASAAEDISTGKVSLSFVDRFSLSVYCSLATLSTSLDKSRCDYDAIAEGRVATQQTASSEQLAVNTGNTIADVATTTATTTKTVATSSLEALNQAFSNSSPIYITKYITEYVGIPGPAGSDGRDGKDGKDGANGLSVSNTQIQPSYSGFIYPSTPTTPIGISTIGYLKDTTIDTPTINAGTATNLSLTSPTLRNAVFNGLSLFNDTANFTGTVAINTFTATSSVFLDALLTNSTTTNAFVTNLFTTAATSTDSYITRLVAASSTLTDAMLTNSTTTNAYVASLIAASSTLTDILGTNAVITNATFTNSTTTRAYVESLTIGTSTAGALTLNGNLTVNGTSTLATTTATSLVATNATTTSLFSSLLGAVTSIMTNLTVTNATTTNLFTTNSILTNSTTTNAYIQTLRIGNQEAGDAVFTNATTTNLFTQNLSVGNASIQGNQTVDGAFRVTGTSTLGANVFLNGNVVVGTSTNEMFTVNALVNSNFVPAQNKVYDMGSPSFYWRTMYADTINVNTLAAASSTISGTSNENFTINSDNGTGDTENSSLVFFRGLVTPNALLRWNSTLKRLESNMSFRIQNETPSVGTTTLTVQAGAGQNTTNLFELANYAGGKLSVFNANGWLGLGTSSPSSMLSVTGSTTLATTTINGILTVNGNTNINQGGTLTVGDKVIAPGEIGAGTSSPSGKISIQNTRTDQVAFLIYGSSTQSAPLIDVFDYPGSNQSIFRVSPTGLITGKQINVTGTSTFATSGGNVGIGIANPSVALDVNGIVRATGQGIFDTLSLTHSSDPLISFGSGNYLEHTSSNFNLVNGANGAFNYINSGGQRFTVSSSGNVGIGTTTPSQRLSVQGFLQVANANADQFLVRPDSNSLGFSEAYLTGQSQKISLFANPQGVNQTGSGSITYPAASAGLISGSTASLALGSNGSEKVRIDTAGNVGIGTTTPAQKLDVAGYVQASSGFMNLGWRLTGTTGGHFDLNYNNGAIDSEINVFDGGTNNLFHISGTEAYYNGGNVGIGTTSPVSKLSVVGESAFAGGASVGLGYAGTAAPSNGLIIQGNVGIGTTTPESKLVVQGNTRIEGNVTATGALTLGTVAAQINTSNNNGLRIVTNGSGDVELQPSTNGRSLYISKNDGANTKLMVVTGDGNVGIGTTSPNSLFAVSKNLTNGNVYALQQVDGQTLGSSAAGSGLVTSYTSNGATWGAIGGYSNGAVGGGLGLWTSTSTGNPQLYLASNANVGIGTTTPASKLHIAGVTGDSAGIHFSPAGWLAKQRVGPIGSSGGALYLSSNYNVAAGTVDDAAYGSSYGVFTNTNITFGVSTTTGAIPATVMMLTSSGNVGIGTTTPGSGLEVYKNSVGSVVSSFVQASTAPISGNVVKISRTNGVSPGNRNAANAGLLIVDHTANTPLAVQTTSGTDLFNVSGVGAGYFAGSVGIGTTSPAQSLHIDTGSASVLPIIRLSGGGLATANLGRASNFFTASSSDLALLAPAGQKLFFGNGGSALVALDSSGNFGIGVTAPNAKLDVLGDIQVRQSGQSYGVIRADNVNYGTGGAIQLNASNTAADQYVAFGTTPSGSTGSATFTEKMRILSSGNVGIGTTGPGEKLEINTGANDSSIRLSNTTVGTKSWNLTAGGGGNYTAGNFAIRNVTDATTPFFILGSSGNVGIGTTNPTAQLQVYGTGNQKISIYSTSTSGTATTQYVNNTMNYETGIFSDNNYGINYGATRALTIQSNGNVGIGTTTVPAKLTVNASGQVMRLVGTNDTSPVYTQVMTLGSSGMGYIGVEGSVASTTFAGTLANATFLSSGASGTALQFGTAGVAKMTILSGGNVGIGVTAPLSNLHVGGSNAKIRIDSGTDAGSAALELANYPTARVKSAIVSTAIGSWGRGDMSFVLNSSADDNAYTVPSDTKMIIKNSGNVGIGTMAADAKFNVQSAGVMLDGGYNGQSATAQLTYTGGAANNAEGASLVFSQQYSTGDPTSYVRTGAIYGYKGQADGSFGGGLKFKTQPTGATPMIDVMTLTKDGNVGIGTTTPAAKLDVQGTFFANSGLTKIVNESGFGTFRTSSSMRLATDQNGLELNPAGFGIQFMVGGTEYMRLNSSGNVGIGTTTPVEKLQITGGNILLDNNQQIKFKTAAGTPYNVLNFTSGDDLILWGYDTVGITSGSSGLTRFTVDASGNVGIGTTTPGRILDVQSTGVTTARFTRTDGTYVIGLMGQNTTSEGAFGMSSNDLVTLVNGAERMRVTSGGNVGIGTTTPIVKLDVSSGNDGTVGLRVAGTAIDSKLSPSTLSLNNSLGLTNGSTISGTAGQLTYNSSANGHIWQIGGTEKMRMDSTGNVGIGTTTPLNKLTVYGSGNVGMFGDSTSAVTLGNSSSIPIIQGMTSTTGNPATLAINPSGGNVGIGTTSPSSPLRIVTANDYNTAGFEGNGAEVNVAFKSNSTNGRDWRIVSGGNAGGFAGGLFGFYDATASAVRMVINSSGNVGIGTTTPLGILHVQGSGSTDPLRVYGGTGAYASQYVAVNQYGTLASVGKTDVPNNLLFGGQGIGDTYARIGFGFDYGTPWLGFGSGSGNRDVFMTRTGTNTVTFSASSSGTGVANLNVLGNVGIGTTTPTAKLDVDGYIRSIGGASAPTSGYGVELRYRTDIGEGGVVSYNRTASGYLPVSIDGSETRLKVAGDTKVTVLSSGNVGIGTTTPTSLLQVGGNGGLNGSFDIQANTGSSWFSVNSGTVTFNANGGSTRAGGVDLGARFNIAPVNDSIPTLAVRGYSGGVSDIVRVSSPTATSGDYFIIKSTGNIGIGTTSPAYILDISKSQVGGTYIRTINTNSAGYSGLYAANDTGFGVGYQALGTSGTGTGWDGYGRMRADGGLNGLVFATGSTKPLVFATNDIERMRIDGSGNLGIGTTTPVDKLHIAKDVTTLNDFGGLTVSNATDNSKGVTLGYNSTGNYAYLYGRQTNVGPLDLVLGLQYITIKNTTGNVGIGTSTPGSRLDVWSTTSSSNVDIFRIASSVGSANNIKFRIDSDGDVFTDGGTTIGSPADVAESYSALEAVDAGTVVAFGSSTVAWSSTHGSDTINASSTDVYEIAGVRKAVDGYEAVGVVSTRPGLHLGADTANGVPVALSGRVPVKVTTENGPVLRGDYLTVSPTRPGYAMKLTGEGRSIGRALSDYEVGRDKVMMMVENGFQKLDTTGRYATTTGMLTTGNIDLNANGVAIYNVKSLASANGTWSIDENGRITAKMLCLEDVCIDKTQLSNMLNSTGQGSTVISGQSSASSSTTLGEVAGTSTSSGDFAGQTSTQSAVTSTSTEPVTSEQSTVVSDTASTTTADPSTTTVIDPSTTSTSDTTTTTEPVPAPEPIAEPTA